MPTHKPAAGKKTVAKKEPLLNAVARKLGYVAGTVTHVAQGLAASLPTGRSGRSSAKPSKAAAIKTSKSTHRKKSAAASLRTRKTRSSVRRKAAVSTAVTHSSRKRAAKH